MNTLYINISSFYQKLLISTFFPDSSESSCDRQESADSSDLSVSVSHSQLRQRPSITIDSSQLPTVQSETFIKAESKSSLHMQPETMCWEKILEKLLCTGRFWNKYLLCITHTNRYSSKCGNICTLLKVLENKKAMKKYTCHHEMLEMLQSKQYCKRHGKNYLNNLLKFK